VPQPCREGWVNKLVCVLKRVEVWIDPRQLRVGDLFDDKTNKFVAEILANVRWEIFDSGNTFAPLMILGRVKVETDRASN